MSRPPLWDKQSIQDGFDRFRREHGRLPTAPELDDTPYLPSSRQIQRAFGGLVSLRKELGYLDTNFGVGAFRSDIARTIGPRGRKAELSLQQELISHFHEVFVHVEKPFSSYRNRLDFYVYAPDGNFGVDVFDTTTMRDLQ